MTKFFEPIDVSAIHIYHSALELCPTSSIVRKLYYDRRHGITRLPRVMIGNPDSWDLTISFSDKYDYNSSAWSPCGRFVAAQTKSVVEIRNQLTFQLLTVLQSPKNDSSLNDPLEYSPDGRSLASVFSGGIVIWDVQTGGVARTIGCRNTSFALKWSLDGRTIITTWGTHSVETYDIASSTQLFNSTPGPGKEYTLFPWAHETSFRALAMPWPPSGRNLQMSISEFGSTRIKVESLNVSSISTPVKIMFSPSTYRISILAGGALCVMDARNSHLLLEERGDFSFPSLSFDGGHLAAPLKNGFHVWKFSSDRYVLLGEFLLPHIPSFSRGDLRLAFSPNSTSILSRCKNVLQVWRLHSPPTTTPQTLHQHAAISRSGCYIATAFRSTVTIIDLRSEAPSQFVDTDGEIEGLAITGNVLLVAFSEKVVGWLLTKEGTVNGVVNNGRASHSDSIWNINSPLWRPKSLCFTVSGQVGVIGTDNIIPFTYCTETGGVPDRVGGPQHFDFSWSSFYQPSDYQEYHYLRHHGTPQYDPPPVDDWLVSRTKTGKAAWVVDSEGRHRFWVPVEWRAPWDPKNCHQDIRTFFTKIGNQPVMIKF